MHLDRYLDILRLLADSEAQLEYERDVPIAKVPAELVCLWFDDLAAELPDHGLDPADASRLMAFTTFFNSRLEDLPDSGGVAQLHDSVAWQQVMAEARSALDDLGGGASDTPKHTNGPSGRR